MKKNRPSNKQEYILNQNVNGHAGRNLQLEYHCYFDCQQLSDAATFHTTLTRAAPSMATATSPTTAPTPSQHQGTGSVPPRSGNIFQKIRAMANIFFRFAKNTGWERTGPTTTLHTLPE